MPSLSQSNSRPSLSCIPCLFSEIIWWWRQAGLTYSHDAFFFWPHLCLAKIRRMRKTVVFQNSWWCKVSLQVRFENSVKTKHILSIMTVWTTRCKCTQLLQVWFENSVKTKHILSIMTVWTTRCKCAQLLRSESLNRLLFHYSFECMWPAVWKWDMEKGG